MPAVIALKPDQVPIALPRSPSANDALMIARLPGTRSAPPSPCTARAAMSSLMLDARPHHTEAAVNSATPIANTRLRPKRSPAAPPTSSSADKKSAKDSITHCASNTDALNSRCSAGIAMLTTVPSMKAMLEARMVAARIHGAAARAHGAACGTARTAASSQGSLVKLVRGSLGPAHSVGLPSFRTLEGRSGIQHSAKGPSLDPGLPLRGPQDDAHDQRLAVIRPLELHDVELLHLHHRLEGFLRLLWVSAQHLGHPLRYDLPRRAKFVLEPATLLRVFVAAFRQLVPVVVELFLRIAEHLERDRFIEFEDRTAVEAGERLSVELEL